MKYIKIVLLLCLLCVVGGSVNAQKFLKKTLKKSGSAEQLLDGFVYKWYEYSYLQGKDTLYAAFDLNGNRITPNSNFIGKNHRGVRPSYKGGLLFSCTMNKTDITGEHLVTGYNSKGELIFPLSLQAIYFFYEGDRLFTLSHHNNNGREIRSAYNARGECLIPASLGYNFFGL